MRYLVTLKPLEPFMFGGKNTFGSRGNKEEGTYIVKSNLFPQQTAILGMLQHEVLKLTGLLTRKRRGEWVDKQLISRVKDAIGDEKFDLSAKHTQSFGVIKSISSVFLTKEGKRYIKKADTATYTYKEENDKHLLTYTEDNKEKKFSEKEAYALQNNYLCIEDNTTLQEEDIFRKVKQVGNQKTATPIYRFTDVEYENQKKNQANQEKDNAYFKKVSYTLQKGFAFAFYLDYEEPKDFAFPKSTPSATFTFPKSSIVTLGADRGMFRMQVSSCDDAQSLAFESSQNELVLLSDSYIAMPVEKCAAFAITSEVESRYIKREKGGKFAKSEMYYLYEKGSVFIDPTKDFIEQLNNENLQNIGFNHHSKTKGA